MDPDVKEFFLKEYEKLWDNWKVNYEIRDRWVRFYFLGFSIFAGIFGLNPTGLTEPKNPVIISVVFFVFSIFAFLIFYYDIVLRQARREFMDAINKIRGAFKSEFCAKEEYFHFPVTPKGTYWGKREFVPTVFLGILTSINLAVSSYFLGLSLGWIIFVGLCCLTILTFIALYFLLVMKPYSANKGKKMNIKRGFFRLSLVLSILIGTMAPFCHEWIFDETSVVDANLPDKWENKSPQEKLSSIDSLLLDNSKFFALPKIEQLNIRRQLKESIISDVKSPKQPEKKDDLSFLPDQPKVRFIGYFFSFKAGWRELSLLAFVGFASPWLIYLFIRWVIIVFIAGGFKG